MQQYDAIVIGTGQSGPALAVRLAKAGQKTAIIERARFGGTCVNTGCIPTKTLIASARAAHVARLGADFGVMIAGEIRIDMARVKARKDRVVEQSAHGVADWLRKTPNLNVIQGHARFDGAHAVSVNGELLRAQQIFINVGARAQVPDIPGIADIPYLTNSGMMDIDFLPQHLLIVGGSYIGLEFAQMYRRFGSQVTVIEAGPRLIAREDQAVSAAVRAILEAEGIAVLEGAGIQRVAGRAGAIELDIDAVGEPRKLSCSHLLLATGRTPNTDDLGLEQAGIETDARGYIRVDEQLATNVPGVWALGDVNGRGAFTHTSYNDYEIVAANLLDGDKRRVSDRIQAYALYTDPPLARIGMTEREARASGRKTLVGSMQMTRVGRARERGETQGFMRVLIDAETEKIIGATLLGIEADEVIHSLLDVMYAGASYRVIRRAMHIHPTVSELIPTLLENLEALA